MVADSPTKGDFAQAFFFKNFGTPHLPCAGGNFLGIVKEMAGKWILGGVPRDPPPSPKMSAWVGRLDPPGLKKNPDFVLD